MSRPGSGCVTVRNKTWDTLSSEPHGEKINLDERVLELVVKNSVEVGGAVEGPTNHTACIVSHSHS